jgi:hypothetical protein
MPAPVIEACDMPTVFEPAVEKKYLPQKIAGTPEIIFFGTCAKDEFHCLSRKSLTVVGKHLTAWLTGSDKGEPNSRFDSTNVAQMQDIPASDKATTRLEAGPGVYHHPALSISYHQWQK